MISLSIGLFKINGKPLVSVLHLHLDTHEDFLSHYLMLNNRAHPKFEISSQHFSYFQFPSPTPSPIQEHSNY